MRKVWGRLRREKHGSPSTTSTSASTSTPPSTSAPPSTSTASAPPQDQAFTYTSFQDPDREIRVLEWEDGLSQTTETPNAHPSRLRFRMRTVLLDEKVDFLALSYHWGDPKPVHEIEIDGRILKVAKNLHLFLDTFRSILRKNEIDLWKDAKPVVFWVDGICIDQQSIPEKNAQVPLMGDIYTKARGVIAYIGDCATGQPMAGIVAMAALAAVDTVNPLTGLPLSEVLDEAPVALRDIANQSWYMRSWVTQEMVLARKILCLYGNASTAVRIDQAVLAALVDRAQKRKYHNPRYAEFFDGDSNDDQMAGLRQMDAWSRLRSKFSEKQLRAIEVMHRTRPTQATDLRDKVYSVLALLPEDYRVALRPDYSTVNSPQDVYKSLAQHMVRSGDGMSMLYYAGTRKKLSGLPSWVPDWSFEPYHRLNEGIYKATGMLSAMPPTISLSDDGDEISLSAILWGYVDYVHVQIPFQDPNDSLSSLSSLDFLTVMEQATHALCERIKSKHGRYPCNGDIEDVVWRTLVADAAWDEDSLAGDAERAMYDAYLATQPRGDPKAHIRLLREEGSQDHFFGLWLLANRHLPGRRLASTAHGDIAVLPNDARVGDIIAVFICGSMPFVLRPRQDGRFELVGPCYLYGHMTGLILFALNQMAGGWNTKVTKITLV